jgi:hypothetical protein
MLKVRLTPRPLPERKPKPTRRVLLSQRKKRHIRKKSDLNSDNPQLPRTARSARCEPYISTWLRRI